MEPIYVDAVGLAAPGLPGWAASVPTLAGRQAWAAQELAAYAPERLPPNERRRATATVRLAFRTAEDALAGGAHDAAQLATVFASSDGDLDVVHRINTALAQPARLVSPTDFHNSVHNAAAGYWSIAVGAKHPSTSLAAHDASFTTGLVEAAALVQGDGLDTLLVAYDVRAPAPLAAQRSISEPFGVALVLAAAPGPRSLAALELAPADGAETPLADAGLESLRRANPAARALPLLRLLARRDAGAVLLPSPGGLLSVSVAAP